MARIDDKQGLRVLMREALNNDGATLVVARLNDGIHVEHASISDGYMVSNPFYEFKTIWQDYDGGTVRNILAKYASICAKNNADNMLAHAYVGIWFDDDNLYIDISHYYPNKAQSLDAAKFGNQKAIYDNTNKTSIYI